MRVLILTASYGSGHNAAARSLAAAFARAGAAGRPWSITSAISSTRCSRAPRADSTRGCSAGRPASGARPTRSATGCQRLAADLRRHPAGRAQRWPRSSTVAPDAVVTVHATPAVAMAALAARGVRLPPHTTVVTDFVAHSQWIARGIDRYCVAADEVKHEFVARGIPPQRVVVTGVPVRAEFEAPVDPAAARAAFGLSPPTARRARHGRRAGLAGPPPRRGAGADAACRCPCRPWSSPGSTAAWRPSCARAPPAAPSGRSATSTTSGGSWPRPTWSSPRPAA